MPIPFNIQQAMFVSGTVGYPQPFNKPEHWSSNFKDFIGRCLEMDPVQRANADELLKVRPNPLSSCPPLIYFPP